MNQKKLSGLVAIVKKGINERVYSTKRKIMNDPEVQGMYNVNQWTQKNPGAHPGMGMYPDCTKSEDFKIHFNLQYGSKVKKEVAQYVKGINDVLKKYSGIYSLNFKRIKFNGNTYSNVKKPSTNGKLISKDAFLVLKQYFSQVHKSSLSPGV